MTHKRLARKAIKDWPEAERPREKLVGAGSETLTDDELLAILLRIGCAGQSAEGLGRELLTQFEGLNGINRIQFNIPGCCNKILFIHRKRTVSFLPEMPLPTLLKIYVSGITPMGSPNGAA